MTLIDPSLHANFSVDIDSPFLFPQELLMYHCGCHGNLVITAMKYAADVYCAKEH